MMNGVPGYPQGLRPMMNGVPGYPPGPQPMMNGVPGYPQGQRPTTGGSPADMTKGEGSKELEAEASKQMEMQDKASLAAQKLQTDDIVNTMQKKVLDNAKSYF
jgi:hypothetical protein